MSYCKLLLPFFFFINFTTTTLLAAPPKWIWYPGDFEIWLGREVQTRRNERGHTYPPIWRLDTHSGSVRYRKKLELAAPETFTIHADGQFNIISGFASITFTGNQFTLPAGKHELLIVVLNYDKVPALWVQSPHYQTDETWEVTDYSGQWLQAASWQFSEPTHPPSTYRLHTTPLPAPKVTQNGDTLLADFGKETFGYLQLEGIQGNGHVTLYYGESKEEALSTAHCETLDRVELKDQVTFQLPVSRAFRYVRAVPEGGVRIEKISALYEYLPVTYRGSFSCSDEKLNRIWQTSAYTLHLNTRELFLDGIKRDRWVWSGDAYQSYLMNYYLFFDPDVTKRTLYAVRGKDPVVTHLNTILDYSFYWFIGLYDYFQYTADAAFLRQIYPRMKTLMDFCLARTNANGMVEGLPGDWVFIDWADMEKDGEVSFEQMLFARSLETMALCAELAGDAKGKERYNQLADNLKRKLIPVFWSEEKHAFMHSRKNDQLRPRVTRYPNMFAIMFGYLDSNKVAQVKQHVLLNDDVQAITTPYMRFYELAALCEVGEQDYVRQEMLSYWGGMLDLGATSFWETFDPKQQGKEHLAMYDRPFGKSLCHAWGASPVYLTGKYFLGVKPLSPGYATYVVEPNLGGLDWMEGKVPTPQGEIAVRMDRKRIKVQGTAGTGTLRFRSKSKPSLMGGKSSIRTLGNGQYEVSLQPNTAYTVKCQSVE